MIIATGRVTVLLYAIEFLPIDKGEITRLIVHQGAPDSTADKKP